MNTIEEQFLVDASGHRTAAVVGIERYKELLEAEEELDCVRAFDAAEASGETPIPFAQAIEEIETGRV